MTTTNTRLTPEEQVAVMRWPEQLDIGIIHAAPKVKEVHYTEWQKLDFSNVNFRQNLESGIYDEGIAIRTGKTISGNKYLVVLRLRRMGCSKGMVWQLGECCSTVQENTSGMASRPGQDSCLSILT